MASTLLMFSIIIRLTSSFIPCNHTNKQRALYAHFDYNPSLVDIPATELEAEVTWVNVSSLRNWGSNGIYDAFMIHFQASPPKQESGGYFGVQAHGSSNDMLLFSLWDKNPGHNELWQASIPWKESPNCHRHCNDRTNKTNHSNTAPDGTTGTQCEVHIPMMDSGSTFRLNIKRIVQKAKSVMYNRTWNGDVYRVSVKHIQSAKEWSIGSILVDGSYAGIWKMSSFNEHIGCTPCKAFEFRSQRRGPWILHPPGTLLVDAYSEGEGDDSSWLCFAQQVTSQQVGELELHTGTLQDFNKSGWDVDPLYVCNATNCAYPGL